MRQTPKIDGKKLRNDRKSRKLSQEALVRVGEEKGKYFSLSSVRRAEQGNVEFETLETVCSALGTNANRYLIKEDHETSRGLDEYDITGRWTSFYLEDDKATDAYARGDTVFITQMSDGRFEGVYESDYSEHPFGWENSTAFQLHGKVLGDCMTGEFYVDGRNSPQAWGCFQLR